MAIFSKDRNDDERLTNSGPRDDRSATDRSFTDRPVTENRESADPLRMAELYAMLTDVNALLPVPPQIPGYHLCWLTTTNNKDTLESRFRLGYSLVAPSELPGFQMSSQKDSQVSTDRIMVNEMVLAKISHERWVLFMTHLHHTLPQESMQDLKSKVRIQKDGKGRDVAYTGGDFKSGAADGYTSLGSNKPANFAGIH